MKVKTKNVIIITIVLMLVLTISTISYAMSDFVVDNVNVTVIDTKAEISWDKSENADGYEVYVELPSIGYINIGTVEDNKVSIIGFTRNESYSVKIRAYKYENNTKIYSDFSSDTKFKIGNDTSTSTKLGKVKNVKATSLGTAGTLEWDSVKDAKGYEIYASLGENEFVFVGSTENTRIGVIGMNENEVYRIKIRAYTEENGRKKYGEFSDIAILKSKEDVDEKVDKVENLKVSMSEDDAKLTWNKVKDADGYEIAVDIPNKGEVIYKSSNNSETLTGFSENCTYKARVRAYKYVNGKKVYGDYSDYVTIRYEREDIEKVENLKVKVDEDDEEATVTWNRVSGADGYEVVVYKPGRGESEYTVRDTKKVLTGIRYDDDEYWVEVRAYEYINGDKVYGEYSDREYFRNDDDKKVEKVTGVDVKVDGTTIKASWDRVKGADGYECVIYIPGKGSHKFTTTGTSKTLTGVSEKSKDYYIKVRAYDKKNGKKYYGEYSSKVYFNGEEDFDSDIDKVTGLNVVREGQAASFKWNKVRGADGYELVIYVPGHGERRFEEVNTRRSMTGFTSGRNKYKIKVRAYKYVNGRKVYGDYSSTKYF